MFCPLPGTSGQVFRGGKHEPQVPWSSASQRYTEAFESWTIRLLQATNLNHYKDSAAASLQV